MISQIESPHARVEVTHNIPSEFISSVSVWPHADRTEDPPPTFRISISKHFDYSVSGALFALLPDHIPTSLSLFSDRHNIFRRDDPVIYLRDFLLSLPPNVEELHTQMHQHLVTCLSDIPRLEDMSRMSNPPIFSLPSLKRIVLEERSKAFKVFRPSYEYTRFEEILKARKALSAEIEILTIKTTPHHFCSMDEEPLLELVKVLEVVHYEDCD
ncbi:hypothetical protein ONZ45_g4958 [Pleurotus djamor]|nr:hypothetical protein ONZ45_g4958 [Pleurotus djamor]